MKKQMQLFIALLILIVALPFTYATACQAGCSSCNIPASNCPTCTRYDFLSNWSINPCIYEGNLNFSTPINVSATGGSYYVSLSGAGLRYSYCQNVSIRAIMYYGTAYEQDSGWTTSDVPFVPKYFSFIANHSGVSTLKIMTKYDSGATWDVELINMTIALNTSIGNINYGDCISSSTDVTEGAGDENAISISFDILPFWGASTLYIFFMIGCVAMTWCGLTMVKGFDKIRLAISFLVFTFLMFIGAATGVIGYAYLFVIFIGFAVWIGIKIKQALG